MIYTNKFNKLRLGSIVFLILTSTLLLPVSETKAGSETEMPIEQRYVTHDVAAGDNLYLLSAYYYGNARLWERIFNENRDAIKNPNRLDIGAKLKIPVDAEWSPRYSIEEFRKMTGKEK